MTQYLVERYLPGLTPERLEENRAWLEPRALEPGTGRLILCFQSYILRTPDHTVLVDSCIGNDKDGRRGRTGT